MEPLTGEILNINNKYGSYQEYKTAFDQRMQRAAEDFVWFGYHLKLARDTDILKESGYGSVNEFAEKEYGLDKSQVSRFIRINDEYSENGYSDRLQEKYQAFGYAKLAMMLTLPAAVSDELTASYTKSEIGMLKEEIDEENKVSDLEVMMEERDQQQEGYGIVGKVLHQMGHDDPKLYLKLYDAVINTAYDETGDVFQRGSVITEVLAPSGEAIHSVRIAGEGRKMLSIKGPDTNPVIIDVRSQDKHYISWYDFFEEAEELYGRIVEGKEGWEQLYGEPFPAMEEPKNTPVAPVQPKKEKKVTKAKVQNPTKPHKDQVKGSNDQEENHETEDAQTTPISRDSDKEPPAAVDNGEVHESSDIGQHEAEPTENASGTGDGDGPAAVGDDTDAGKEPPAAGQLDGQMSIENFPEYMPDKKLQPQGSNVAEGYLMALKDNLDLVYGLAEKGNIAGAEARLEAVRRTLHKIAELMEE